MAIQKISRRRFIKSGLAALATVSIGSLLTACSSPQKSESTSSSATAASAPETKLTANKVLVVYFSASGNTERVAKAVADELGADTFVIEPKDPYTDADLDWTDPESRVNEEHENESMRHVELKQSAIPNLEAYETVLFGYPTWWQQACWVVNDIATGNDFTGKTVIPFTTSMSSPLGTSGQNLAKLAGTGDWREGRRFSENAPESEIAEWAKELRI